MWVTSSYLGVEQGAMGYLFFLLTQDFIEENKRIHEALEPLLTKLARDFGESAAVVRPFRGDEANTCEEVLNRGWTDQEKYSLVDRTPALLVLDSELERFDPRRSAYLIISLRDSLDEIGNLQIFETQALFDLLREGAQAGNLFDRMIQHGREQGVADARKRLGRTVRVEPEFMGVSFNVREAVGALRAWLRVM